MNTDELLKEFLPTLGARASVTATVLAVPAAWAAPHLASPLWPSSTQAEILLAQASLSLLVLSIGLFLTLAFVVAHQQDVSKELRAAREARDRAETALAKQSTKVGEPPARDHTDRLDPVTESVLVYVTENPDETSYEVAAALGVSEAVALHHLERLRVPLYVEEAHLPGSAWSGTHYRHQWSCRSDGRTYLATHGLLK